MLVRLHVSVCVQWVCVLHNKKRLEISQVWIIRVCVGMRGAALEE